MINNVKEAVEELEKLGYSSATFHFLFTYFGLSSIIIKNPFRSPEQELVEQAQRSEGYRKLFAVISLGDKELIERFSERGRAGATQEMCADFYPTESMEIPKPVKSKVDFSFYREGKLIYKVNACNLVSAIVKLGYTYRTSGVPRLTHHYLANTEFEDRERNVTIQKDGYSHSYIVRQKYA